MDYARCQRANQQEAADLVPFLLSALQDSTKAAAGWMDDATGNAPEGISWYETAKELCAKAEEMLMRHERDKVY